LAGGEDALGEGVEVEEGGIHGVRREVEGDGFAGGIGGRVDGCVDLVD
jgi:hypothetical protein